MISVDCSVRFTVTSISAELQLFNLSEPITGAPDNLIIYSSESLWTAGNHFTPLHCTLKEVFHCTSTWSYRTVLDSVQWTCHKGHLKVITKDYWRGSKDVAKTWKVLLIHLIWSQALVPWVNLKVSSYGHVPRFSV